MHWSTGCLQAALAERSVKSYHSPLQMIYTLSKMLDLHGILSRLHTLRRIKLCFDY